MACNEALYVPFSLFPPPFPSLSVLLRRVSSCIRSHSQALFSYVQIGDIICRFEKKGFFLKGWTSTLHPFLDGLYFFIPSVLSEVVSLVVYDMVERGFFLVDVVMYDNEKF